MGALRDEAEALGIDTDTNMKAGAIKRKIAEVKAANDEEKRRATKPKQTTTVRLLKHFKPYGWYEVVGHFTPDEELVKGVPAPSPYPGVSYEHKLWAGTVVTLPTDEAKGLVEHVDEMTLVERDPETRLETRRRVVKKRRQLAEVYVDWSKNATGFEVESA